MAQPEAVDLPTYALFAGLGLAAALAAMKLMKYPARQAGVATNSFLPALALGAIVGAKIPVWMSYGFSRELLWNGKSYFGALLGGFLAINIAKAVRGIKGNFGDRFVVPLCVGAAVGKLGCHAAGCCAGLPTDFVLATVNHSGVAVHPAPLYEATFQAILAVVFVYLYKAQKLLGSHFLIYLLSYMAFRFVIEFVRTEPRVLLNLTVYQWLAILFIPFFSVSLWLRLRYGTVPA
jgi:prolipoprotein diacylglyceryltransferase